MDAEITVTELTADLAPAAVRLCEQALDLPEDAVEAAAIVDALWPRAAADRTVVGLGAYRDADLVGVLLCSVSSADPALGHVDLVAVLPDQRRRGVGRALIERAERVLAEHGVTDVLLAGNPPYYAWPGIDVRYTPAVCAALALGYQQDRTAWNMTADLSYDGSPALRSTEAAQRRLAGQGITVRRADPADLPALTAFARSTFGGAWDGELAGSVGRDGAGCHLAERAGELLGFAAYGSSGRVGSGRWAPRRPPRVRASAGCCCVAVCAISGKRGWTGRRSAGWGRCRSTPAAPAPESSGSFSCIAGH